MIYFSFLLILIAHIINAENSGSYYMLGARHPQSYNQDLDGDGKIESISVEEGKIKINQFTINTGSKRKNCFEFVDIDKSDSYKEILLWGQDDKHKIYLYDGKSLRHIGNLSGDLVDYNIDGSGIIYYYIRGEILLYEFQVHAYKLNGEHELVQNMGTGNNRLYPVCYPLICENEIYISSSRQENRADILLKKGDKAEIIETNNKDYIKLHFNGIEGYLFIDDFHLLRSTGYSFGRVFPEFYNKKLEEDLNGDGKKELILLLENKGRFGFANTYVFINKSFYNYRFADCSAEVVDISKNDKYKVLVINAICYGIMTFPKTVFLSYREGQIKEIGKLNVNFNEDVKLTNEGIIEAPAQGSILFNWTYIAQYKINSELELEPIEKEYYEIGYNTAIKNPLPLYAAPRDTTLAFTLEKDGGVRILGSDNKSWVYVEDFHGRKGWFQVRDFHIVVSTKQPALFHFKKLRPFYIY